MKKEGSDLSFASSGSVEFVDVKMGKRSCVYKMSIEKQASIAHKVEKLENGPINTVQLSRAKSQRVASTKLETSVTRQDLIVYYIKPSFAKPLPFIMKLQGIKDIYQIK